MCAGADEECICRQGAWSTGGSENRIFQQNFVADGAEVDDGDRNDIARELGSMRKEPDLDTLHTGEPGRIERRRIPSCPQCDATNAERVEAAAPSTS